MDDITKIVADFYIVYGLETFLTGAWVIDDFSNYLKSLYGWKPD